MHFVLGLRDLSAPSQDTGHDECDVSEGARLEASGLLRAGGRAGLEDRLQVSRREFRSACQRT